MEADLKEAAIINWWMSLKVKVGMMTSWQVSPIGSDGHSFKVLIWEMPHHAGPVGTKRTRLFLNCQSGSHYISLLPQTDCPEAQFCHGNCNKPAFLEQATIGVAGQEASGIIYF